MSVSVIDKNYFLMGVASFILRNHALADYLESQGYLESLDVFKREADVVCSVFLSL